MLPPANVRLVREGEEDTSCSTGGVDANVDPLRFLPAENGPSLLYSQPPVVRV